MSPNPKPSGNGKDTTEKGGKNPPAKEIPDIVTAFSEYFGKFRYFRETAKKIEKKYNIERDEDGFWEDDDIKRVWGKTTRLSKDSKRRKTLCLVTMLEMLKKRILQKYTPSEETETQPVANSNPCQNNQNSTSSGQISPETCYIRIPLSVMDDDYDNLDDKQLTETVSQTEQAKTKPTMKKPAKNILPYKLINAVPSLTQTMRKTSYVLQYNNHTRNATWVFEILNNNTKGEHLEIDNFTEDLSVHKLYRTPVSSMSEGYNRGHLAAAGNHNWHQKAKEDTFLMSNIVPQNKKLNKGKWKELEDHCRKYANNNNVRNVLVYTGPLYCPENDEIQNYLVQLQRNKKAVPTHLFKVIIVEYKNKPLEVECYMIPNKNVSGNLNDFKKELKDIEEKSGLLFSEKMPTINLEETVKVRFKPPNEKSQNEKAQNQEGQNKEKQSKEGIQIELKVTPYKNDLFDSIG